MRILNKLLSGIVISAVGLPVAMAEIPPNPGATKVKVTINCPKISDKSTSVVNYGSYLAGNGIERVNSGDNTYPLFQGQILPGTNIPVNLDENGYKNSGVTYNPADGGVVCKYKTNKPGYDGFSISYMMENALNGEVAGAGHQEIHLKIPLGLH